MAFCKNCGAQVSDSATICPSCGQATGAPAYTAPGGSPGGSQYAPPGGVRPGSVPPSSERWESTPPVSAGEVKGFIGSLFDFSFTSFVTTKLIKVLYALGMILSALYALVIVVAAFKAGAGAGLAVLVIVAPLVFFAFVIYWRVVMELIIVIFRASEHLAELVRQGRRT